MKRVLLVHEPPDGGVAQHVLLLARRLHLHRYEVEVAGPPGSNVSAAITAAGIPHHELPFVRSYSNPLQEPKVTGALRRLIRSGRFDLLHAHSSKAGVHGRLAAAATRTPAVYTPHCFGFVGRVSPRRRVAATTIERTMAPLAKAILCVCQSERDRALELKIARAKKLRLTLQGIPAPEPGIAIDRSIQALHRRGPVIGAVNALRPQKRTDLLLEAIPAVWHARPDATFAVVGSGPMDDELRARARALGLEGDPRFAFVAFQAPSERYLRGLDLFVLPSDWEALPIGLLEAMASGVPQVASDVDGNREAVSAATGRLVAPGDPRALAAALIDLLNNPAERARLARGSRERHATTFTIERMVAETAAVYDEILKR